MPFGMHPVHPDVTSRRVRVGFLPMVPCRDSLIGRHLQAMGTRQSWSSGLVDHKETVKMYEISQVPGSNAFRR